MKLVNLNSPQDVMALLVRRKWWIALPFIGLSAGVALFAAIVPRMYVSESLVIIRPRDVPDEFVKDLIAGSTNERLSVISEMVLSDQNLNRILRDLEDEIQELRNLNQQEKIERLRKQINLQFSAGDRLKKGQLPISAFRISCHNRDPLVAQKIVRKLTERFLLEDTTSRQDKVNATAEFLKTQVDDLAAKRTKSDTRLKEVRSRRRDELPNQNESNLRRLENLSTDNQALRRDRTNYVLAQNQLEQQLAETPKRIPKTDAGSLSTKDPDVVEDYRKTFAELKTLKIRRGYTDEHPDVTRLNLQLQRLEDGMTPEQLTLAKMEETGAPGRPTEEEMQTNPVYANMERSLEILKKQIEMIDERTARNDEAITVYNEHVNNVPQGEQEITDVLRENTDLDRQYQEMSSKLSAARLSEDAENLQKGEQFQVIDSASLPLTPTKPSKSGIVAAGLALSLLIALAIGFVVDIVSQRMWTQSDITHLMGLKVLVEVPRIVTHGGIERARKKRFGFLTSVSVAAVVYGICLYLSYAHSGFVLHQLDPLIQKLY